MVKRIITNTIKNSLMLSTEVVCLGVWHQSTHFESNTLAHKHYGSFVVCFLISLYLYQFSSRRSNSLLTILLLATVRQLEDSIITLIACACVCVYMCVYVSHTISSLLILACVAEYLDW